MARYTDGFAFADSILGEDTLNKTFKPEFIALYDREYLELLIATLALNSISRINYVDGKTVFPDYDRLYEKACEMVEAVDLKDRYIQTDIEASHEFCGSPWDIWVRTPAQYVTVIQGFALEDDERTIRYHQNSSRIDEVINLLETNRVKYAMSPDEVRYIVEDVACLDLESLDYELAPSDVYQRLNSYIQNLA
jgi:hypothetical protein